MLIPTARAWRLQQMAEEVGEHALVALPVAVALVVAAAAARLHPVLALLLASLAFGAGAGLSAAESFDAFSVGLGSPSPTAALPISQSAASITMVAATGHTACTWTCAAHHLCLKHPPHRAADHPPKW